ncbi:unnamed protein product [Euphydryas editha]|uniref:Uncharacterized protein n=1 Tax=Euphydryas editha TaxID=104508 RepID=A0AAU9TV37_EUPED|nr:unnamed protein product [Euphydryas editha]
MPKTLKSGERMMALKVKKFFEREKRNNAQLIPLKCVQARVAAITGVSEKTVSTITKEEAFATINVKKVEEKYYAYGPVIDSETDRFIIEVGDDSDTSDDEDDMEDEVDDDLLYPISPLDEHFLSDHNYNKSYYITYAFYYCPEF